MPNDLIPEETAKAIQKAAKLLSKVIDAGAGIGRYLDSVFERIPHNLVGYFGGDGSLSRGCGTRSAFARTQRKFGEGGVRKIGWMLARLLPSR
jgi:hypothetical protein